MCRTTPTRPHTVEPGRVNVYELADKALVCLLLGRLKFKDLDVIGSAKRLAAVCYLRGGHFTVGEPCNSRFLK
jgi:hypothetical protein